MSTGTISPYERRSMLPFVELLFKPKSFLINKFFPRVETFRTKKVDIDVVKGLRRTVPYNERGAEGYNVKRNGYKTYSWEPPMLTPIIPLTEADLDERAPGEGIYDNGGLSESEAQSMAKDLAELEDMNQRTEEIQAMEIMKNGTLTPKDIEGNTVGEVIDFNRHSSNTITLTGADRWSQSGSNPIKQLRSYRRDAVKRADRASNQVLCSASAWDYFETNSAVKDKLNLRRGDVADKFTRQEMGGGVYLGSVDGFDFWEYPEWYIDSNNAQVPFIPDGYIILAPDMPNWHRAYGGIFNEETRQMEKAARRPDSWTQKNPKAAFVKLESAPLCVPREIDSIFYIKVG